jgi:hypothetical protein
MSLESEVYSRLSGFAGLTALVSTRIYPLRLPQDTTLPAVTFTRLSASRLSAMGSDPGLVRARVQYDAWTEGSGAFDGARAIAEQIRAALQRWRTTSGTIVQDSFLESEVELYEADVSTVHVVLILEHIYEE